MVQILTKMGNVFFYNSDRKLVMEWNNFRIKKFDEGRKVFVFEIRAYTPSFSVLTTCSSYFGDLLAFKNGINALYQRKTHEASYTSFDEILKIRLYQEEYGHIIQEFSILNTKGDSILKIESYFDETFLPELEVSIRNLSTETMPKEIPDERFENNNSFRFLCNFEQRISFNYILLNINIANTVFEISTNINVDIKEVLLFVKGLEKIVSGEKAKVVFNPLGELMHIRFLPKENGKIDLEGYISEVPIHLIPQGKLKFHDVISLEEVSEIIFQLENCLLSIQ